jgi:two-component system chemotaxis response regulator CheB
MLSNLTQLGAKATIKALQLGAVDFIPKPSGAISLDIATISQEIINKVKTAASAHVIPSTRTAAHLITERVDKTSFKGNSRENQLDK